jgi:hypothetical protein
MSRFQVMEVVMMSWPCAATQIAAKRTQRFMTIHPSL